MGDSEPFRRVSAEVEAITGYRFCTAVATSADGVPGRRVLLAGDRPYEPDLIVAELDARDYPVVDLVPADDEVPWTVRLRRPHQEADLVYVRPGRWEQWRNVRTGDGAFFNHQHRAWQTFPADDRPTDDRWLMVSRELMERIAGLLPVPLPDPERQARLAEQYARRRSREANRSRAWYDQRAERFDADAQRLRRQAEDLIAVPPLRDAASARFGVDEDVVAALPAVPVPLDEPFPLLRHLHGQLSAGGSWFVANKPRVVLPGGEVTLVLTVWTTKRPVEYLAVTPFNPPEGYPVDDADTDPVRRAAKLDGPQRVWGGVGWVPDIFPSSPNRLWIISDPVDPSTAPLAAELWLELTFPGGRSYLAAPGPYRHGGAHHLIYQEFVPTARPELAEVPGLAPPWVSLNVPPYPELLKTVTARLRHLPYRPRPHRPGYVEE